LPPGLADTACVDVLEWVADWHAANEHRLAERGIASALHQWRKHPKQSVGINLTRGDYESELLAWESGEVELGMGRIGRPSEATFEHHEITTRAELLELLERIARSLPS
jgi:hypothetical protein